MTLRTLGISLAVHRSNPSRISLEPTLFESYLRDERLDAVLVWLINAVHMVDAPAGSGARWESLWSSLVFELGR